jgi:hypothetical protein
MSEFFFKTLTDQDTYPVVLENRISQIEDKGRYLVIRCISSPSGP